MEVLPSFIALVVKINGIILQKQFEKLLLLQIFWDTAFEVVSN